MRIIIKGSNALVLSLALVAAAVGGCGGAEPVEGDEEAAPAEAAPEEAESDLDSEESLAVAEQELLPGQTATCNKSLCAHRVCLYQHANYEGVCKGYDQRHTVINLTGFNDQMSSFFVAGAYNVTFWWDSNNKGSKFVRQPGYAASYVGDVWNDETSSIWIW